MVSRFVIFTITFSLLFGILISVWQPNAPPDSVVSVGSTANLAAALAELDSRFPFPFVGRNQTGLFEISTPTTINARITNVAISGLALALVGCTVAIFFTLGVSCAVAGLIGLGAGLGGGFIAQWFNSFTNAVDQPTGLTQIANSIITFSTLVITFVQLLVAVVVRAVYLPVIVSSTVADISGNLNLIPYGYIATFIFGTVMVYAIVRTLWPGSGK